MVDTPEAKKWVRPESLGAVAVQQAAGVDAVDVGHATWYCDVANRDWGPAQEVYGEDWWSCVVKASTRRLMALCQLRSGLVIVLTGRAVATAS